MMEDDHNFHRSERLMRIKELLSINNLTTQEIRLRLELPENQTRALQRDLKLLLERNDIEKKPGGKYAIKARKASSLNPAEALAAYSAARLFFHHAPEYNKHYLRVMDDLSSKLPERVRKITEQMASIYLKKSGTRQQSRSLEHCSIAWLDGHWLKFDYHAPSTGKTRSVELAIYFIEINPHNRAAYAIGYHRNTERPGVRVFKVARMRNTQVLKETYEPEEDFNALGFMQHAWGVSVGATEKVVLTFKGTAREWLLEENLDARADVFEVQRDGSVRVELTVGNTTEILPWIKGWGGWVTVESPGKLRDLLIQDLQAALQNYQR